MHERLRLRSVSGGLSPSRGREAACTPEGRVNQPAGVVEKDLGSRFARKGKRQFPSVSRAHLRPMLARNLSTATPCHIEGESERLASSFTY